MCSPGFLGEGYELVEDTDENANAKEKERNILEKKRSE